MSHDEWIFTCESSVNNNVIKKTEFNIHIKYVCRTRYYIDNTNQAKLKIKISFIPLHII